MKHLFTLIALVLLFGSTWSQTLPYTLTIFTEPYQELTESELLSGDDIWDDPSYLVDMPFEYQLFGDPINDLLISGLGSQVLTNTEDPELVVTNVLIPYFADIVNASIEEAVSSISSKVEGEPGDRILKLEWKNVGFYYELQELGTSGNTISFQVWFYEADQSFEYRYGPNTIKSGDLIHFANGTPGVVLAEDADIQGTTWSGLWSLAGEPSSVTPVALGFEEFYSFLPENQLTQEPSNGLVYRFANYTPVNTTESEKPVQKISLWPTVAQTEIFVSTTESQAYQVYDMVGKLALSGRLVEGVNNLNVSSLGAGTYIIQTEDGQRVKFMKKG